MNDFTLLAEKLPIRISKNPTFLLNHLFRVMSEKQCPLSSLLDNKIKADTPIIELTGSLGKAVPHLIGNQVLTQVVQKVLDKTAQHMDIADLPQVGHLVSLDQLLLELFDLRVGAIDSVEANLVAEDAPLLDLVDDHLQDGWDEWRVGEHIVVDLALRRMVQRGVAGTLQHVLALGVHDQVALATLHDHFAELGALVAMAAQLAVEDDLWGFERIRLFAKSSHA